MSSWTVGEPPEPDLDALLADLDDVALDDDAPEPPPPGATHTDAVVRLVEQSVGNTAVDTPPANRAWIGVFAMAAALLIAVGAWMSQPAEVTWSSTLESADVVRGEAVSTIPADGRFRWTLTPDGPTPEDAPRVFERIDGWVPVTVRVDRSAAGTVYVEGTLTGPAGPFELAAVFGPGEPTARIEAGDGVVRASGVRAGE